MFDLLTRLPKEFDEIDDAAARRRKKKTYYAKLKKQEEEREKELAEKYRDRVNSTGLFQFILMGKVVLQ